MADVKKIINKAQAARIERNDLVARVARIIDPGAFAVWHTGTAPGAPKHEPDVRQRYAQAVALHKAEQLLKLAARTPDLAGQLAREEADAWRDLGVPLDRDPEFIRIIERKYAA